MGGPCFIVDDKGKKRHGPDCTDNFQIRPFVFDGAEYYSCEQAYQALKYPAGRDRDRVIDVKPFAGETSHDHGDVFTNETHSCTH